MNEVTEIQEALRAISLFDPSVPRVVVDGLYGFETKKAVSIFQKQYGLPETGNVDPETWDMLMQASKTPNPPIPLLVFNDTTTVFKPGDQNETIGIIKAMITALSSIYSDIPALLPSSLYDEETAAVIRRIRRLHDLEENDLIDLEVWQILATLYNHTRFNVGRDIS